MMNAILSGFSEVIAFLLQSFRLAFVVPAFIFLGLNAFFILPALPPTKYSEQFFHLKPTDQLLLIAGASFLFSYFLSILNLWIIRLFEGYHWRDTGIGKYLVARKQAEKQWWMDLLLERVKKVLSMQDLPMKDPRRQQSADDLEEIESVIEPLVNQILQERYPVTQQPFLPTSLGNAIAAFEDYPRARYGIDAVLLWPRFLPTLTNKKFAPYIQRSKDQFDFLINLCFLLLLFSLESLCVGLALAEDWSLWVISTGIAILTAIAMYKLALLGVYAWGTSVRVAFDLYRYDLLESLSGITPNSLDEEKEIWLTISRFLKKGRESEAMDHYSPDKENEPFDYKKVSMRMGPKEPPAKAKED